jgi:hypothetical protein
MPGGRGTFGGQVAAIAHELQRERPAVAADLLRRLAGESLYAAQSPTT